MTTYSPSEQFTLNATYSKIYNQCWTNGETRNLIKLKMMNTLPKNIHINTIQHGKNGSLYILCKDNRMFVAGSNKQGQLGISAKYITERIHTIIQHWFTKFKVDNNIPTDIIMMITNFIDQIQMQYCLIPIHICTNLKVKYISRGIHSTHRFILTAHNKIYVTGNNENGKLGILKNYNANITEWTKVNGLDNIKQIETTETFSVCLKNNGKVFSTWIDNNYSDFIQIKTLKYQFITEISCGNSHCLILNNKGCVYSFGITNSLHCVYNDSNPVKIAFPDDLIVKIVQVKCGAYHSLCLDDCGDVYSFGQNTESQCGTGEYSLMEHKPYLIGKLENIEITDIKCGLYHNMTKSIDNEYYLWGSNGFNECLVFNHMHERSGFGTSISKKNVMEPTMFNPNKHFGNNYEIVDMYLGLKSTKIVTRIAVPFLRMYQICKSETAI